MKKLALIVLASTLFTGCASVMNDTNHGVKIETRTADGKTVTGAECKLSNDYGTMTVKSGDTAQVRRSATDLQISCEHPENGKAEARAVSRANGGMWGNVILGGGIGALVDHNRGTAYTYPTWLQLVFGQSLIFDRKNEKVGQPVESTDKANMPGGTQPAAAAAAK